MKKIKPILSILVLNFAVLNAAPSGSEIKIFNSQMQETSLSSNKDKLLVALWATWCPDCKTKLKGELGELAKDPDIEVLALNTEKNTKKVQEFMKAEGVNVPLAYDKDKNFRKSLELFTVPAWAVYQKDSAGSLVLIDKGSPFDSKKINLALGKKALKE